MHRLFDAFSLALERLRQHVVLVLWALIGLSAATTLALSLTLYVDAVNTGLLESRLDEPPYAFRYRYVGAWEGNISQADVARASAAVQETFIPQVGFPVAQNIRFARGGNWALRMTTNNMPLGAFSLGHLTGIDAQIRITQGTWPPPDPAGEAVPVMLPQTAFYTMGIQLGDQLTAIRPGGPPLTVAIVALWAPLNPDDPAWIFPPSFFDTVMLTDDAHFWPAITLQTTPDTPPTPVEEVAWFVNFDGASVQTADVGGIIQAAIDGERAVSAALPGVRQDISPREELDAFNVQVSELTQQLIIMLLPVAGLVLYFVGVVAEMLVGRQQTEDAVLSSRGMSRLQIVGNHLLMWLILAGAAFLVGLFSAPLVVDVVGRTTSFLRFDYAAEDLQIVYTQQALLAGAVTALLAASNGLILAWGSSAQTINRRRQARAREGRAWWQRYYLDVMMLVPAAYTLYTLQQQGGITTDAENPFADPLTFIGPTLFALGMTLMLLRFLPVILRGVARVVAWGNGIALLMALRELTRATGRYRGALLMMCLTLSLTGFMASMASTLDRSLKDSIDYRTGADAVAVTASDAQTDAGTPQTAGDQVSQTVTGYNALPVNDLYRLDGIREVSRVGRYQARLILPGQRVEGTALGIDRASIAAVTRAREDYADASYAELFNRLATERTGVLINRGAAEAFNLVLGQRLEMQVFALGAWYDTTVPIVGVVDYFPTLDPRSGFFLVMNIDPIFELAGSPLPHNIWLGLHEGVQAGPLRAQVADLGFPIIEWRDPEADLLAAQTAPARRGVFGFLSVGFVASIVLTLIVAIIQSAASFRAQSTQLGTLRAMGLGGGAVSRYLLFSQGLAAASGVLGGTAIGFATTVLYLPLLDFSGGLPPYLIRVAWGDIIAVYAVFAAILFSVIVTITFLLGREQLSTVVKLGDA